MSSNKTTQFTCPRCNSKGELIVWNSINADINPELKDDLISGELLIGNVLTVVKYFLPYTHFYTTIWLENI